MLRRLRLFVNRPVYLSLLIAVALLLGACAGQAAESTPVATPTLIARYVLPTPTPAPLVDQELLGAANATAACDAPPEATFTCTDPATAPVLEVDIAASTFARWSLHWQDAPPLTGDETLALQLVNAGNLAPNLYLVTADGQRMGVALSRFGLHQGDQTLHVPLREVRDVDGNTLDFAQVNGLEIVFEWADMQGTFAIDSVRFDSVWREPVTVGDEATALAATLETPDGFVAKPIADNLPRVDPNQVYAGRRYAGQPAKWADLVVSQGGK